MPLSLELTSEYSRAVLVGSMGKYIVDKVKKPLMKAIIILADRFPDPTRENVSHPNTHILLDIRDKFFEYYEGPWKALFRAAFKLLIAHYEPIPPYRDLFDWFIDEIKKSEWLPRSTRPMGNWKEPRSVKTGTVFPTRALSKIMEAGEPSRSKLFQDLILSATEERVFEK